MITEDRDHALVHIEEAGATWIVKPKEWDSNFFSRSIAALTWKKIEQSPFELGPTTDTLRRICADSDRAGCELLECHMDLREFSAAAALEAVGFRLVDTRIRFLSRWTRSDIQDTTPDRGEVASAEAGHRDRIIELTHQGFTNNERFFSRFKNREYFTEEETRRYFEAWLEDTAFADDSATAVYLIDGKVVGYYIYQVRGSHEGLPLVKGILTAVDPAYRGANAQLAMQAHLYRCLDLDAWYLDNTTQLSNATVIRNHIRSRKHLEELVLTFYRKRGA